MKYSEVINLLKKEKILINEEYSEDLIFNYISYNSLDIEENTLFFCKGYNFKEQYLYDSIKKGVTCYISEIAYKDTSIPLILVSDIRKAIAIISNKFYDSDSSLYKIGITGTKGKTTTVYFIHNILDMWKQKKMPFISTIDYYTGKSFGKSHNTTPDSLELAKMLHEMKESNLDHLVMEVSSQAVRLDRIYGLKYEIGAFLNIGLDHIAPHEHKDFQDYLDCKLEFLKHCTKVFIYKQIDKYEYITDQLKDKEIVTFGFTDDCDFVIKDIEKENDSTKFNIIHKGISEEYRITISGKFNCINACCAVAIAKELNISYDNIYKGLYVTKVDGRMSIYKGGICPIIVDYAHNKLSIENLFSAIREDYPNCNLKIVVGCPGEKAFNRRKEVADLCGQFASHIYLTAEDPASVDVSEICNEIISYLKPYNKEYEVIEDRELAIIKAIRDAKQDDVIAIIGKGDETYQLIGTQYVDYKSDMKVVEEQIEKITN